MVGKKAHQKGSSLVFREMQVKATITEHYIPIKMAVIYARKADLEKNNSKSESPCSQQHHSQGPERGRTQGSADGWTDKHNVVHPEDRMLLSLKRKDILTPPTT